MTVDGQLISTIGKGLLVLAAVAKDDSKKEVESMASKILKVKMWDADDGSKWKRNVQEIDGEVLCGTFPSTISIHPFIYPSFLACTLIIMLLPSSFPIHPPSLDQKGQQTILSQFRRRK